MCLQTSVLSFISDRPSVGAPRFDYPDCDCVFDLEYTRLILSSEALPVFYSALPAVVAKGTDTEAGAPVSDSVGAVALVIASFGSLATAVKGGFTGECG